MARGLKFRIQEVEGLFFLCGENKGADQLSGYSAADQRLCFQNLQKEVSYYVNQIAAYQLESAPVDPYFGVAELEALYNAEKNYALENYSSVCEYSKLSFNANYMIVRLSLLRETILIPEY